jgi:hypothetical protein
VKGVSQKAGEALISQVLALKSQYDAAPETPRDPTLPPPLPR